MDKVYKFDGEKYTVIRNQETMSVRCLRHNVPWLAAEADMVGNNLAHWMLNTIDDNEEQLAKQKNINEQLCFGLESAVLLMQDLPTLNGFGGLAVLEHCREIVEGWQKGEISEKAAHAMAVYKHLMEVDPNYVRDILHNTGVKVDG